MRQGRLRSFVILSVMAGALFMHSAGVGGHVVAMESGSTSNNVSLEDVEAIRQLGRAMGNAMVAVDMGTLDQIYADDWAAVAGSAKVMTKQDMLESIRIGERLSYQLGPIDVRVLGDLAVAHGTVKERRLRGGKPLDIEGVYMDFFARLEPHP